MKLLNINISIAIFMHIHVPEFLGDRLCRWFIPMRVSGNCCAADERMTSSTSLKKTCIKAKHYYWKQQLTIPHVAPALFKQNSTHSCSARARRKNFTFREKFAKFNKLYNVNVWATVWYEPVFHSNTGKLNLNVAFCCRLLMVCCFCCLKMKL